MSSYHVRRTVRAVFSGPRLEDHRSHKSRDSPGRVNDRRAGEIGKTDIGYPTAAPNPMAHDRINKSRNQKRIDEIVQKYGDRLVAVHLKDWLVTDPDTGLDKWPQRGRFCELGAGNIGLDNGAVMKAIAATGYDGWVFVEHDTHLQDPLKDLAHSREYLRKAGF